MGSGESSSSGGERFIPVGLSGAVAVLPGGADPEMPLVSRGLVSLCEAAGRGLFTTEQLWAVFDRTPVFMVKPDYYGMHLASHPELGLVTLLFSSVDRLARFVGEAEWVGLDGGALWDLPVQARLTIVDPGDDHRLVLDARTRPPVEDDGTVSFAVVDVTDDGDGGVRYETRGLDDLTARMVAHG